MLHPTPTLAGFVVGVYWVPVTVGAMKSVGAGNRKVCVEVGEAGVMEFKATGEAVGLGVAEGVCVASVARAACVCVRAEMNVPMPAVITALTSTVGSSATGVA